MMAFAGPGNNRLAAMRAAKTFLGKSQPLGGFPLFDHSQVGPQINPVIKVIQGELLELIAGRRIIPAAFKTILVPLFIQAEGESAFKSPAI